MNRYTNGRHRNNANRKVKKTNRIVNSCKNRSHIVMRHHKTSMSQKYKSKHSSNKKMMLTMNRFKLVCMLILCMLIFVITNKREIAAYFTDLKSITNIFSINAEYTVKFYRNSGTGTMQNQIISYNVATTLTHNSFTKTGYSFVGWNTNSNGTGISYTNGQEVTNIGDTILYAQWEKNPTKYAVQIYGINQDEDAAGNKLGLTFGPTTGANYNNAYVTHTYEETSSGSGEYYVKIVTHTVDAFGNETISEDYLYKSGGTTDKVTRTTAEKNKYDINMHEMTWSEIQAVSDKTTFLDCMLCGDTKSVNLTLNGTIGSSNVYDQFGDGAGNLFYTLNSYYRKWNPSKKNNSYVGTGVSLDSNELENGSNARYDGGYSVSHIRATLIGENSKTNKGYAGNVNLDSTNSLYACIESDLQNVITAKKVKYVTGTSTIECSSNDDISDKIWLFSSREVYGSAPYTGHTIEGLGTGGEGYNKFGNNESRYYIPTYNYYDSLPQRVCYCENGSSRDWWLRSPCLNERESPTSVNIVSSNGNLFSFNDASYQLYGLSFGFCIDSSPVNYSVKFNSNTGSGTMTNQQMVSNVPAALTANAFTKTGYTFKGWNTQANGSGTSYTNKQVVSKLSSTEGAIVNLYAQWEKAPTKYAVQIYGINQDEDAAGNTLGLTFGPATGANYNNSYVTHTYEETSSGSGVYYVKIVTHTVDAFGNETISEDYLYKSGGTTDKVTRTTAEKNKYDINMHEMTWAQIQAVSDKTTFLDCMLCGDTKSVSLTLNSILATSNVYNQYGDGAGMLRSSINDYYKGWNPRSSDNSYVGTGVTLDGSEQQYGSNARNAGGYSSSHIRATLVGKDSKTNEGYAGNVNLDTSNSLYSCIESDLQNVITAKKVKYVTGISSSSYSLNDDISDKIWLFSSRELYGTGDISGFITEGIGTSGGGYDKFGNNESKYYISSYNNNATDLRKEYNETGSTNSWLLRSPYLGNTYYVRSVEFNGSLSSYYNAFYPGNGLAFGFCIDSSPVNYSVKFNSNTGSGTMANQQMVSNVPTALTANAFTKTGYIFKGWNTEANGTGTSYTNKQVVSKLSNTEDAVVNLYAQWEKAPTKYAVQIYGINQDEDLAGNKLGLTFGPATGADYNNTYVTHTYEETSSGSGMYYVKIVTHTVDEFGGETTSEEYLYKDGGTTTKVTRTTAEKSKYDVNMHEMTWSQIQAVSDKTAFLDCMLCGDTKSVGLNLNSTIGTGNLYNQYGDGSGFLSGSINNYYRMWNPRQSNNSYVGTGVMLDSNEQRNGSNARNAGGYASSHIRATLVGKDSKTNEGYAGNVNLDYTNSLYTCLESDLQNVIAAKKVKYVTGTSTSNYNLNDDISDKIWLFSERELYGTGNWSGIETEGIGTSGDGYSRYGNNESKYYMSSYNNSKTVLREVYSEVGSVTVGWIRSINLGFTYVGRVIDSNGFVNNSSSIGTPNGLAFGFCMD